MLLLFFRTYVAKEIDVINHRNSTTLLQKRKVKCNENWKIFCFFQLSVKESHWKKKNDIKVSCIIDILKKRRSWNSVNLINLANLIFEILESRKIIVFSFSSYDGTSPDAYWEPCQTSKMRLSAKIINGFQRGVLQKVRKKFHLRCLTGFWRRLC